MKKEYSNGELTIVWQPDKCIHSGNCVRALPKVYDPKARPWITMENATNEELIAQIRTCPTGALSYKLNTAVEENVDDSSADLTLVEMVSDGPLLVSGSIRIKNTEGQVENKDGMTAFCRCGHSANKPYCDGAHRKAGFRG